MRSEWREQFYSIILPCFCDSQQLFCLVSVGHPGSFKGISFVRGRPTSWGRSTFPCSRGHAYNWWLFASANEAIQRERPLDCQVFGTLKSKFRRLKCLHMKNVKNISSTVTACCILHNICLESSDHLEEDQQTDDMEDDPYPAEAHIRNDASHYRDTVCGWL